MSKEWHEPLCCMAGGIGSVSDHDQTPTTAIARGVAMHICPVPDDWSSAPPCCSTAGSVSAQLWPIDFSHRHCKLVDGGTHSDDSYDEHHSSQCKTRSHGDIWQLSSCQIFFNRTTFAATRLMPWAPNTLKCIFGLESAPTPSLIRGRGAAFKCFAAKRKGKGNLINLLCILLFCPLFRLITVVFLNGKMLPVSRKSESVNEQIRYIQINKK